MLMLIIQFFICSVSYLQTYLSIKQVLHLLRTSSNHHAVAQLPDPPSTSSTPEKLSYPGSVLSLSNQRRAHADPSCRRSWTRSSENEINMNTTGHIWPFILWSFRAVPPLPLCELLTWTQFQDKPVETSSCRTRGDSCCSYLCLHTDGNGLNHHKHCVFWKFTWLCAIFL